MKAADTTAKFQRSRTPIVVLSLHNYRLGYLRHIVRQLKAQCILHVVHLFEPKVASSQLIAPRSPLHRKQSGIPVGSRSFARGDKLMYFGVPGSGLSRKQKRLSQ